MILLTIIALGTLPLSALQTELATAQSVPGFFEGEIPIQGAYLRAINTYPGITPDSDNDGVLDKGCQWDDNGDGTNETHVVRDPLIVNLETQGFYPGDTVMISFKQSTYSTNTDFFMFHVFGLFSSSKELLTEEYEYTSIGDLTSGEKWPMIGPLNRVPGAIDAALGGYRHGPQDDTNVWKQAKEVENDIPEDFRVGGYQEANDNSKNYDPWGDSTWWFSNGFWITIPLGAKFLFFQIAGYWNVGDAGYCRVTVDKDTDGDAIPDSWERRAIDFNKDRKDDLTLTGANYLKKDIFVEVDYMEGHRFNAASRDDVVYAFRNCPATVENGPINIHVEIDDSEPIPIVHQDRIRIKDNSWGEFEKIKDDSFGTLTQKIDENAKFIRVAKEFVYHYCLFAHGLAIWNGTDWEVGNSGIGEYYGNDFIVALGVGFKDGAGSRDEQAATFMHELGHNLGLNHGGFDDVNYKPNYLSIMNYLFTFDGAPLHYRPLTFSSVKLPRLDETKLNEVDGLRGANWDWTVYSAEFQTSSGTYYAPMAAPTNANIDWDNDADETEISVQANINNYPGRHLGRVWDYVSTDEEVLEGYDDWSNLLFYFQANNNFAKGVHDAGLGRGELTWEAITALREAGDKMSVGPTGPVNVIEPSVQPTPTKSTPTPDSSKIQTNPFFSFFDQAIFFAKSNPLIVGGALAAIVSLIVASSFAKRRKKPP